MVQGAWVQGMLLSSDESPMDWQLVLHYRLTSQFDRIPAQPNTAVAEDAMRWGHQAYFFVGRPHPYYSSSITLFEHPHPEDVAWFVTPFDTGGLIHGKVVTAPELDAAQRVELIEKWSWHDDGYLADYDRWVDASFGAAEEYVRAGVPTMHLVEEIDLSQNTDFSWTWEGRFPATRYTDGEIHPFRVLLSSGRRRQYFEYLRQNSILRADERAAYMRWAGSLIQEDVSPVKAAQDVLCERMGGS
ncbi:hypothetical protein [Microbacterium sp. Root553]|uniref:hypothetical protein n=1 Tax=Microbacterium sp. Root553 TaxID=1736556 RepID=UPI0006F55E75|nr:hypothetical protein [Microbacterium sp. Root553]KQZ23776.1 hypothetical protein ASD43_04960 [Microbacterium sp. Root553]